MTDRAAEEIAWARETVAIYLGGGGPTAEAAMDELEREFEEAMTILYGDPRAE